eukprot:SAG31_NODE_11567_length_1017_cov_0.946623_1_plen_194_part_10
MKALTPCPLRGHSRRSMRTACFWWVVVLVATVAIAQETTDEQCELAVSTMRALYQRDCLDPLDSCIDLPPDNNGYQQRVRRCNTYNQEDCAITADCSWVRYNATGAGEPAKCEITRPGSWQYMCHHNRECPNLEGRSCQAVFDTIVDACRNASSGDWPYAAERPYLTHMGCDAGPFMPNEGLSRFLAQSVGSVC